MPELMVRVEAVPLPRVEDAAVISPLANVTIPFGFMENAALVDVASAVDVARKNELLMLRIVHALLPAVVSVRASCGPVLEATVSAQNGVVVPMPTRLPVLL